MQTPLCTPAERDLLENLGEELSPDAPWQCLPQIKSVTDRDFVTAEERTKRRQTKEQYFHLFWVELLLIPYLYTCIQYSGLPRLFCYIKLLHYICYI